MTISLSKALVSRKTAGQPAKPIEILRPSKVRLRPEDYEFLAADLEILEKPASPVRMGMIISTCALAASALTWSWFGRIDIVAIAQGKIAPTGQTKVIQPLEGGKVAAIRVQNGKHVKRGDTLIELEPADAKADEAGAFSAESSLKAELVRRKAEIDAAGKAPLAVPTIDWPADIPVENRQREEKVLAGDIAQLKAQTGSLDAQIGQKTIERDHLDATIASQTRLIGTLKERVDMKAQLFKNGWGTKTAVLDASESLETQQTTLANQTGQRAQAQANLSVLAQERDKIVAAFVAETSQKLSDAQRQSEDVGQKLVKAQLKTGRLALTSPIDGVVTSLSVTTVGQVIGSGEETMRIVPDGASLEIEAYIANSDIGFVSEGQAATIKIDAFPFTRYGAITGKVEHVALDAIPEPDAQAGEADATKINRNAKSFAGAQRIQNLVFPITLSPDRTTMDINGRKVALTPGMSVTVEVATGNRRILEYLFAPVVETIANSMKER